MKIFTRNRRAAFTLIELLAICATIVALGVLIVTAQEKRKTKSQRISCVGRLKQIGLSFRIWVGDSSDWYPMARSTNDGGTLEFITTGEVFRHFQTMSNELGRPIVLVCPADKQRKSADDFLKLSNFNLSYFVGVDASENLPNSILSGDRNITNGFAPTNGMLVLMTNQPVGWTKEIHKYQGNIALGDGSVQQVSSERLRDEIVRNSELSTNRIQLP